MTTNVLTVEDLRVSFAVPGARARLKAVDGLSFHIGEGETLALVGESGSGKSTVARALLGLVTPDAGRVEFEGRDLVHLPQRIFRSVRSRLQMVFQDPWAALNPRIRIAASIEEPLRFVAEMDSVQRRARVVELVRHVGLDEAILDRHPAALSGGQLQRVCIARAIATAPKLLVLDEPTSSLDLSVRGSILTLLRRLQCDTGMSMLFISHDIGSVRRVAKRVAVLYLGQAMESGPIDEVLESPAHPYTKALLDAHLPLQPRPDARQTSVVDEAPNSSKPSSGCPFQPRCRQSVDRCRTERPNFVPVGTRQLACHLFSGFASSS